MPALTTLRAPRQELGRRAGAMLCERLVGHAIAEQVADVGYRFVARATA